MAYNSKKVTRNGQVPVLKSFRERNDLWIQKSTVTNNRQTNRQPLFKHDDFKSYAAYGKLIHPLVSINQKCVTRSHLLLKKDFSLKLYLPGKVRRVRRSC